ncbi:phosphoesterase-domain-containing protein [Calocera viscosa TUFC12733]|uniref:Phosphoesterase-domain-containing protein n=1 Tax=Calocera viscosa (strain TUFC12733) TaxID=1330018 RepID=A0A167G7F6_CALVF|nr:phosphoesterase-domain-containing protein [Calocera viscosa TUFC12733]
MLIRPHCFGANVVPLSPSPPLRSPGAAPEKSSSTATDQRRITCPVFRVPEFRIKHPARSAQPSPSRVKAKAGMQLLLPTAVLLGSAAGALADSLAGIEHVVFFMQENRAFDHYFGTLRGIRGFQDPNAALAASGKTVFHQLVNGTLSNATDSLLPWYLNYLGGNYSEATQCISAGTNGWGANHRALNFGKNDLWAISNTAYAWSHYKREDIPVHFGIADAWTVGDMYQESIISASIPNRLMWQTGTINVPGSKVNSTSGPAVDDNTSPGCISLVEGGPQVPGWAGNTPVGQFNSSSGPVSGQNYSCYPYDWKTVPEYFYEPGVNISWKQYHSADNYGHEVMELFTQYQDLTYPGNETNPLIVAALNEQGRGVDTGGVEAFIRDALAGNLPEISYIITPGDLCEHPPNLPQQGGWAQKAIIDAVQHSPKYNTTALIISYDETGGFGDHVVPFVPPPGTPGEYLGDPFGADSQPSGPGFRVPFFVVSPWTRGGNVWTEPTDHISQLLFLEKWAAAHGKTFSIEAISDWRREHMSDLVDVFDFENPDYSTVDLPYAAPPMRDPLTELLDASAYCGAKYEELSWPPVPYGNQTEATALWVEAGSRAIRGKLTEGRHLVLESGSEALAFADSSLKTSSPQDKKEADATQRFVVHATDASKADQTTFTISAASNSTLFLSSALSFAAQGAVFNITNQGGAAGYYFKETSSGKFLAFSNGSPALADAAEYIKLYSVTF